jgi:hypothetical protein
LRLEDSQPAICPRCKRGREACQWCETIAKRDWAAICDCGLYDFGDHLLDCQQRDAFKYVMPADYDTAELLRDA